MTMKISSVLQFCNVPVQFCLTIATIAIMLNDRFEKFYCVDHSEDRTQKTISVGWKSPLSAHR